MKKRKISFVLNIIIVVFTLIATIMMFTGFKFMNGAEPILETTKLGMFKFFTVDSNLLMGLSSLVYLIQEKKILDNKIKAISVKYYIFKFVTTVSVSLTFLVVLAYLGPLSKDGILSMLQNSNLFFHLIIPLLSIISFVFFEYDNGFKFKYVIYSILPTVVYAVFYLINIIVHIENGKVSPMYDWYWFVQGGLWQIATIGPLMIIISYGLGLFLWKMNNFFNH